MPLAPTRIIPITRKALFFDGVDDYAELPQSIYVPDTCTVLVFAKVLKHVSGVETSLLAKDEVGYFSGDFRVYVHPKYKLLYVVVSDGTENYYAKSTTTINENEWYLLGARCDGSVTVPIVNTGADGNSVGVSLGIANQNAPFYIARSGSSYGNVEIAYVLIYKRALSDDEIAQIYNDPDHPPKSGLVLWLHDTSIDIENNVWRDLSGKGNNATIYGATAVDVVRPATRVIDATRVIEPTR